MTAGVAILLSFFVAKLVSLSKAGDGVHDLGFKATETVDQETVVKERKIEEGGETDRTVEFVGDALAVNEYEGIPVQVENEFEITCDRETFVEKPSAMTELGQVNRIEEEESVREDVETVGLEDNTAKSGVEDQPFREVGVKKVGDVFELADVICGDVSEEKEESGNGADDEKEPLLCQEDDEDWEGIERSELEKVFAQAVNFVDKDERAWNLGGDVKMKLYGLHKVAMEGPCHEPQPMALKFSARSKWNAWQKLGSMSREMAMELYIALLSDQILGWLGDNAPGGSEPNSLGGGKTSNPQHDLSILPLHQPNCTNERTSKLDYGTTRVDEGSNYSHKDKE